MKELKIEIKPKQDKVTLHIKSRDSFGHVVREVQDTFSRREFERALREASFEVPWRALTSLRAGDIE